MLTQRHHRDCRSDPVCVGELGGEPLVDMTRAARGRPSLHSLKAPKTRTPAERLGDRGQADAAYDPTRLFRVLWRQARLVSAVFVGAVILAVLAIDGLTPVYRAGALVIIDPPDPVLLDLLAAQAPADPARVDSEVEILRSSATLLAVVRQMNLTADPEFVPQPGRLARIAGRIGLASLETPPSSELRALDRLGRAVTVNRRNATALIEISARSASPDKAAALANGLFAAYLEAQTRAKSDRIAAIGRQLDHRLASARALSRAADRKLDGFLADNLQQIADPDLRKDLTELHDGITAEEGRRIQFDALAGRAGDRVRKGEWDALVTELTSDRLTSLHDQRHTLEASPAGPSTEISTKLTELDRQMRKEATSIIDRIAEETIHAQQNEAALRDRLSRRLAGPDVPSDLVLRFKETESDAAALRQVVDKLTANARAADAGGEISLQDARVIAPALPPIDPIFPDRRLFLTLSVLLAALLGIAAGVVRDGQQKA